MDTLLTDIDAFCTRHNISPWDFGERCIGDRPFVGQLRGTIGKKPRRVWPETEAKIRAWMDDFERDAAA